MTNCSDVSHRGTRNLTSELDDKIVIDRQTLKNLLSLLGRCADSLKNVRQHEIFLTSIDKYLSELGSNEADKVSLLLQAWLDVMPGAAKEIADWLDEAREVIKLVLVASKLGGRND